jgi:predicted ATPase
MYPVFKSLTISGWRQFQNISIEFHPRLTVITGANGAGKSSLLNLLTQHFGWARNFLGTPRKKRKNGVSQFSTGIRNLFEAPQGGSSTVGLITYTNDVSAQLHVAYDAQQYGVGIVGQQPMAGTFISSHRPVPVFRPVNQINTTPFHADQAYGVFQSESVQRFQGSNGVGSIFRLKETLVSLAMLGPSSQLSPGDEYALSYYYGFIDVLRIVLPESLGFKNLSIRLSDVVLETEAGSFLLDAASGGVLSLIDLAWQIYAFSKTSQMANSERFVVVMDEPENHLHPSMQRMLLGSLLDAFPSAQFIIATHSPFMVSSVKDSAVYALRYMSSQQNSSNEDIEDGLDLSRQVFSERLDVVNRAGNAAEILRDVLGVPVTVPLWVETQLNSLVIEYRNRELTVESLSELRERMTDLGFGEMYPTALAGVVGV